jgi:putative flippase GtrA
VNRLRKLREPAAFYSVGILNTVIDFGLFTLLSRAFGLPYLVAQVLSYATGAANSYALNRVITFRRQGRPPWHEAGRFAAANALSLVAASLLLVLLHQALGLDLLVAKALSIVASAVLNYAVNRFWVFAPGHAGSRRQAASEPATALERASEGRP